GKARARGRPHRPRRRRGKGRARDHLRTRLDDLFDLCIEWGRRVSTSTLELAISPARGDDDLAAVARLFREYQISIGTDLCFQGFEGEPTTLPGLYAPPRGEILVARAGRAAAGVVALRPLPKYDGKRLTCGGAGHNALEDGVCEMKRLYVRPAFRAA